MPIDLPYPPPTNLLVKHPRFGVCFFTKGDNGCPECRRATSGAVIDTRLSNVSRGWSLYISPGGKKVFYVFSVGGSKRVGAVGSSEDEAKQIVRSKLGLGQEIEMHCIDQIPDAATCTFEEFKNSDEDTQLNEAVDPKPEGFSPRAAETDPSKTKLPPEDSDEDAIR